MGNDRSPHTLVFRVSPDMLAREAALRDDGGRSFDEIYDFVERHFDDLRISLTEKFYESAGSAVLSVLNGSSNGRGQDGT